MKKTSCLRLESNPGPLHKQFYILTLELFVRGFDRNVAQVFLYTNTFNAYREQTEACSNL